MTDKVQKIREEIEKKRQLIWPTNTGEMKVVDTPNQLIQGWLNCLKWIEDFINSLQEEPASEDLEEEIDRCWEGWIDQGPEVKGVDGYLSKDEFSTYARHFAEWQKHKMKKALQTEYEKGLYDMREEMMKDSISCNVDWYDGFRLDYTQEQQDDILLKLGADVGDKVKIIIIKED